MLAAEIDDLPLIPGHPGQLDFPQHYLHPRRSETIQLPDQIGGGGRVRCGQRRIQVVQQGPPLPAGLDYAESRLKFDLGAGDRRRGKDGRDDRGHCDHDYQRPGCPAAFQFRSSGSGDPAIPSSVR